MAEKHSVVSPPPNASFTHRGGDSDRRPVSRESFDRGPLERAGTCPLLHTKRTPMSYKTAAIGATSRIRLAVRFDSNGFMVPVADDRAHRLSPTSAKFGHVPVLTASTSLFFRGAKPVASGSERLIPRGTCRAPVGSGSNPPSSLTAGLAGPAIEAGALILFARPQDLRERHSDSSPHRTATRGGRVWLRIRHGVAIAAPTMRPNAASDVWT
jgi:hypothetical protein